MTFIWKYCKGLWEFWMGPVKSQRIKTRHDTNLTWQGLQCVVQSCIQADLVLPPHRLGLLVFLWMVSVRHKAGNGVLAVALGEGIQQRGPGLLILLWPWWKRLSTITQMNKLSSHVAHWNPFHQRFPALLRSYYVLCDYCKWKEMGMLVKSLKHWKKRKCTSKSFM